MEWFIGLMGGTWCRLAHVALGLALIAVGLVVLEGMAGLGLAAVGAVPVGFGLSGHCMLEPLTKRLARTS